MGQIEQLRDIIQGLEDEMEYLKRENEDKLEEMEVQIKQKTESEISFLENIRDMKVYMEQSDVQLGKMKKQNEDLLKEVICG